MEFAPVAIAIAFFAAMAQGLTGFGFALVLVPLLSLFFDPRATVAVSITLGLATKIPLLYFDRRHIQWRLIAPLTVAAFAGIVIGARLALLADPRFLRVGIAVTVIVAAVLMLGNFRWRVGASRAATAAVGFVSGILTGSTSMGGPPVALFGVNQAWAKESMRGNLVAYFTLTSLFTTSVFVVLSGVGDDVWRLDALMLPGIVAGLFLGNALYQRVKAEALYRVVVLFVLGTGVVGLVTGLGALVGPT